MKMGSDLLFSLIVIIIACIGGYFLWILLTNISMSDADLRERMRSQDMVEMREFLADREYLEEPGKILLPSVY